MSAPLSGTGGPAPGFYPDPSIPGYIRYWNGSSWVPGTSRPEPREGEEMPSPPSAEAASSAISAAPPAARQEPAPTEETGPVFLDEDVQGGASGAPAAGADGGAAAAAEDVSRLPAARNEAALPEVRRRGEVAQQAAEAIDWDDPSRLHGRRPDSASAWQADASRQSGFEGLSGERVSWGRGDAEPSGDSSGAPGADPRGGWSGAQASPASGADEPGGAGPGAQAEGGATAGAPRQPAPEGTVQMRAMTAEDMRNAARARRASAAAASPDHTVGLRRPDVPEPRQDTPGTPSLPAQAAPGALPAGREQAALPQASSPAQAPAQPAAPAQQPAQQAQAPAPAVPPVQQGPGQAAAPALPGLPQQGAPQTPPGPQGGSPQQPSWAQQVQDLAGRGQGVQGGAPETPGLPGAGGPFPQQAGPEPVTPWRPPASDPFLQAAQQEARPAALGKRFGARVVDGLLTSAVGGGVAFLFAGQAVDHIERKIEAVRLSGETKQVWLIDGTTGGHLAAVLGALVLFGLLYEVVPTWRWGRTLGKKLFGLKVLTMEQQEKPGFGSACMRWLVHGALSLVAVGVVNVMWCLFDKPWRQCWHDKLAGTFVSKDSGEIRL